MEQSILRTLAYFDLADYPLTKEELFSYLWQSPAVSYGVFLDFLNDQNIIQEKFGYYFLPGREVTVEKRRERLLISELKMKLACRAAKKIRAVPFVKAIFVCNSVGTEQAKAKGDIDFFIITAPGRIWLVRFFTNLILRLWGRRTYGQKTNNRICLSFYVDSENLDLSGLRAMEDDIHFIYWLHQMVPLYDPENYYAKFSAANNWTKKFLPNLKPEVLAGYISPLTVSKLGRLWKGLWGKMWGGGYGQLLENQARQIQQIKLKISLKAKANQPGNGVVIKDGVLKFHENDRRAGYYEAWMNKLKTLNI